MPIYSLLGPSQKYNFQDYICLLKTRLKDGLRAQAHAHLTKQVQLSSSCLLAPACQTLCPTKGCMEQGVWALGSCFRVMSCGLAEFPGWSLPSAGGWALNMHSRTTDTDWAIFLTETRASVMRWARRLPKVCWAALRFCRGRGICQHQGRPRCSGWAHTFPATCWCSFPGPAAFYCPSAKQLLPITAGRTQHVPLPCALWAKSGRQLNHLLNYLNLM